MQYKKELNLYKWHVPEYNPERSVMDYVLW